MKFCSKHLEFLHRLTPEKQNEVISEFLNKVLDPIELQEKIDNRKNQCPVCYFRAEGPKILKDTIKEVEKNKKKILA